MDYHVLNPEENQKTVKNGQYPNQASNKEISAVYRKTKGVCENTLMLNNSGNNTLNGTSNLSTGSVIQLTNRNVLRDEKHTKKFCYENEINDEEKENQYNEVIYCCIMQHVGMLSIWQFV